MNRLKNLVNNDQGKTLNTAEQRFARIQGIGVLFGETKIYCDQNEKLHSNNSNDMIDIHGKEKLDIDISLEGFKNPKIIGHTTIQNDDIEAVNTVNDPEKVIPVKGTGARIESGKVYASFEPYSYHIIRIETN